MLLKSFIILIRYILNVYSPGPSKNSCIYSVDVGAIDFVLWYDYNNIREYNSKSHVSLCNLPLSI